MNRSLVFLFLLFSVASKAQTSTTVLAKSVSYHDPTDQWSRLKADFYFTERRPSGKDRLTIVSLNNKLGYMKINRNDEEIYEVQGNSCKVLEGERGAERGLLLRNYYLYLWGLPMKLYDKNTPIEESIMREKVGEVPCYIIKVNYEKDTWYFYIDEYDGRLIQYEFYQDDGETKGERITLEGEVHIGQLKIPKRRSWYTLPDMEYLGTDILTRIE